MRLARNGLVLVVPLVALLTWLLVHSVGPRGRDYVFAQRDVARVSLAEAALRADVLQTRLGLLRNYDQLVDDMNAFTQSVGELGGQAMIRREDVPLMSALRLKAAADEIALERFKSDNALLQNSLAYFSLLEARLPTEQLGPAMMIEVAGLGSAMLELTRHPTAARGDDVKAGLARLSALDAARPGHKSGTDIALLATHGRLLAQLLPAVDADLRSLLDVSTDDLRDRIRASQDARRTREERRAGDYRVALYVAAVALLLVLARVGLQWRGGIRLLRRKAEIELLLGDISARLLAASPADGAAAMQTALSQLGMAFGADRAHLLEFTGSGESLHWCRAGVCPLEDSADLLRDAVVAVAIGRDELLDVPFVSRARPGPLRDALLRAGIAGWYGGVLRVSGERRGILSFDRLHDAAAWPPGGTGLLRMASDVVQAALDRRQAMIERAELEQRIGRTRRLEAIGTFSSGIAHNFNNMIAAVMGYAEMAQEAAGDDSPAAAYLLEIRYAGERAQELVGKILEFGSRRTTPWRRVRVGKLLDEVASMLRVTLPAHIVLSIEPTAEDAVVGGDVVQLQQMLMNLVGNAAQAMVEPGAVTVVAEQIRLSTERALSHDMVGAGDYIRLRVTDTGVGMDATTVTKIFQPFFTTRPAGTGLGLATVSEIVHDHGGAIDVQSSPGKGSTFTVWLPASRRNAQARVERPIVMSPTILLWGSSQTVVLNDEEMLAALGYEAVGFNTIEAAAEAVRTSPGRFDAIVGSPLRLDAEGEAQMMQLHALLPTVPMILLIAGQVTRTASDLADLGISMWAGRPVRASEFSAALAECLEASDP